MLYSALRLGGGVCERERGREKERECEGEIVCVWEVACVYTGGGRERVGVGG